MNPYDVLGIRESASLDEVTDRYNFLVRQMAQLDTVEGPLEHDCQTRKVMLRAAFENIAYGKPMPQEQLSIVPIPDETSLPSSPFDAVEALMQQKRYDDAMRQLDLNTDQNAHWNYLYGLCRYYKGMPTDAIIKLQKASIMEPSNIAYLQFHNKVQQEIEEAVNAENRKKMAAIGGTTALVGAGCCASCLCDACCNS